MRLGSIEQQINLKIESLLKCKEELSKWESLDDPFSELSREQEMPINFALNNIQEGIDILYRTIYRRSKDYR